MTSENRTAIVTGASSGIGRRIAIALSELSIDTVIADLQVTPKQGKYYDTDVSEPTHAVIQKNSQTNSKFIETDVADEQSVQNLIAETVNEFGGLDILVNNAGIQHVGGIEESEFEDWQKVVGVNLDGCFLMTKYAVPHLKKSSGGRIVNISSVNAYAGGGGPSYAATKAGILNFTRDLAFELGQYRITANVVLPGVIKTPMQDINDKQLIDAVSEETPIPRLGEPEDVANAVSFLVSSDADWISGAELLVDGGLCSGL